MPSRFLLGTRGSALALAQSGGVAQAIRDQHSEVSIEVRIIKTTGDKVLEKPFSEIGSKGLFTKEIEDALLDRSIDLAVHSLKDLTSEVPAGLELGAILKREEPYDCLVSPRGLTLEALPSNSKVGTSALRRQSQIKALRSDLKIENLRGNLDTRLRKLREGQYDAIVVAEAGLRRLMSPALLDGLALSRIPFSQMLPAVGQGSLAVETRAQDSQVLRAIEFLRDADSAARAQAERSFLNRLQGGCQVPIGALAQISAGRLELEGLIARTDGTKVLRKKISGSVSEAKSLGRELAEQLLADGAQEILETLRA